jgi:hypothetical protein
MRSAVVTLVFGLAALAAIGVLTLAGGPLRVVRTSTPGEKALNPAGANVFGEQTGHKTFCQFNEALPARVSAIRLGIWGFFGERVHLSVYGGHNGVQLLTQGARPADWTGSSVTVPVKPLRRPTANTTICAVLGPTSETMVLLGPRAGPRYQAGELWEGTPPLSHLTASSAETLPGRLVVEYLVPSDHSWWSSILPVAHRLGLGRAFSGTWIALVIAALMAAVGVLAVRLTLRELR